MGNDGLQLVSRTGTTSDARNPLQVPGSFADPHPRRAFTHPLTTPVWSRQRDGRVRKTRVMTLDRDRLVALCRAVGDAEDPEYAALWDEMLATARVDPLEVERLAAEFVAAAGDPDIALQCARSIESARVSPELVARMEEVRRERPHHVVAAAEVAALVDAVRPNPQLALDLALDELRRVERGVSPWVTDFAELFDVLRSIDQHWLDVVIDLVPVEPAVWDGVRSMLGDDELHLIVERLGIPHVATAWQAATAALDEGTDDLNWWAVNLVIDMDWWADEVLHRAVLLHLVADATTLEQLWSVAAGPLEDFLTDDPDRLDWMEQQAAVNPRFRDALAGVWTSGKSSATAARIAAIAPDEDDVSDRWGG